MWASEFERDMDVLKSRVKGPKDDEEAGASLL